MNLNNKAILITGASGGIGKEVAKNLTEGECTIFAHYYKNKQELEDITSDSTAKIIPLQADFSNPADIKRMFEEISSVIEKLDIIVNCVGIEDSPDDPLDTSKWMKVWNVNLFGVIDVCKKSLPILNEGGVIVNISSIMGKHDIAVPIELTSYAVAKTALNKFTLNLAYNYATKLRAVTISPGYTDTKLWNGYDEKMKNSCKNNVPIKRFVKPEEIAKAVRSVIDNDAITAQDILVEGGLNVRLIE